MAKMTISESAEKIEQLRNKLKQNYYQKMLMMIKILS